MEKIKVKKLNEYHEAKVINPEHIQFMDVLYDEINKSVVSDIPSNFKVNYKRGEEIIIATSNDRDTSISIRVGDDKLFYNVKPAIGIPYEFNFDFNHSGDINKMINSIKNEFKSNPNNGLYHGKVVVGDGVTVIEPKSGKSANKTAIELKVIRETIEELINIGSISLNDTNVSAIMLRMVDKSNK